MRKYTNIIFDLDGTVTDSKEGIVKCLQYSLEKTENLRMPEEQLLLFIGAPLSEIYGEVLIDTSDENIQKAVSAYRERFAIKGIYENKLYPGMEVLLKKLYETGYSIFLATIKPKNYAEKILEHFNILKYFTFVMGTGMNGEMSSKEELIKHIIERYSIKPGASTIMIGDRDLDYYGAEANNIKCGAVLYGYGRENEFENLNVEVSFKTVEDIEKFLV